jgi:branched-chain amino acid transport system substrate-binding protein
MMLGRMTLVLATGVLATMLCAAFPAHAEDPIVIGAAIPITGAFASSGIQYYNSLQMAEEDINKAGGINGRPLKILFQDTADSNPAAVNAFIKLIKQNTLPFVFLSSLSTQDLATEPEVRKAKIPALYGGGAVAVQERRNPYMFRLRPPDSVGAEAMAYGITSLLKATKPGVIAAQDDYGQGLARYVEANLSKASVTVVDKETFSPRDNDYSAQLLNLKNAGADAIACVTYNRDGALMLKQRRSLGMDTIPFVSGTGIAAPATMKLVDPGDTTNLYAFVDTVVGDAVSPASGAFVRRYAERFGFEPDPYGVAYYDSAMIMADGMRKLGTDPEKLRDYLAHLKGYVGLARVYTTDENQNMGNSVVLVKFDPNGHFTLVAKFPASP